MTNEAGPNIVYNGLVLYLDAANKRSFNPSENLLTYTNSIGITGQIWQKISCWFWLGQGQQ